MRLLPGQLVSMYSAYGFGSMGQAVVPLYATIPGPLFTNEDECGFIEETDVVLVVALSSFDGTCVYVTGPNGSGWTFGAYLKLVDAIPPVTGLIL